MTRGAGPTFSPFSFSWICEIFLKIFWSKKTQNFKIFDDFFFEIFQNFQNFPKFQVRKNRCTHPEARNLGVPSISSSVLERSEQVFILAGVEGGLVFSDFGLGQRYRQTESQRSITRFSIVALNENRPKVGITCPI